MYRSAFPILIALGATGMSTNANATPGRVSQGVEATYQVASPKPQEAIDLRFSGTALSTVAKLTFSPDSRYLAIVESTDLAKTDIVIWDLLLGKQQARIHCPSDYAALPDHDLLWSHDGTVISFGAKRQWSPITGEALPDNPAIGRSARLNKDGTKMLTIVGAIGAPSYIHVYDTRTWELERLYADGLFVERAAWTSDDKVLVAASVTKETFGRTLDGHVITQWKDSALRVLDPSKKEPTKAVWFPAIPRNDKKSPFGYGFPIGSNMRSNFPRHQIYLEAGFVIDTKTLDIHRYSSFDKDDAAPGAFGMGFSPDGRLLYLKGASFSHGGHAPIKNSIVDVISGQPLLEFDGATDHQGSLAVSPNGQHLALGSGHSVMVFKLQ
ncbi:MAG: WD40 repeat domain-containing protein [Cupriavidus sp.]|nr:WD40 repeat domain-containing protein [Cupriavidus sp.]